MQFQQLLENLGVNIKETLERFSGNEAMLQRFLLKFPKEPTFFNLKAAYDAQDWNQVLLTAHTLKGIAANFGFEVLAIACADLLEDLRGSHKHLPEVYETVAAEYARLVGYISRFGCE